MRQTYRVVASLIALGVLVQAGAVAFGWFQVLNDLDNGLVVSGDNSYQAGHVIHGVNGLIVMPVLGLVLLGVSFAVAGSVPKARAWAGIVLGLILLQIALAFVAFSAPVVGALHGINALLLLGAAGRASMLTRTTVSGGVPGIPAQRTSSPDGSGKTLPV